MVNAKHLPSYTIDDYNRWEGNWELIHGIPYAMSPSPNRNHQRMARELLLHLNSTLSEHSCHCSFYYELDLFVNHNTVVRPDLMLFCPDFTGDYPNIPPRLVIEILSHSTANKDQGLKRELYSGFNIAYYFIVDPEALSIQCLQLQDGKYENNNMDAFDLGHCSKVIDWKKLNLTLINA